MSTTSIPPSTPQSVVTAVVNTVSLPMLVALAVVWILLGLYSEIKHRPNVPATTIDTPPRNPPESDADHVRQEAILLRLEERLSRIEALIKTRESVNK